MFVRFKDGKTVEITEPNPWMVALVNVLAPGLGAWHLGKFKRAAMWMGLFLVGSVLMTFVKATGLPLTTWYLTGAFIAVVFVGSIFDSYQQGVLKLQETIAFRKFMLTHMPAAKMTTEQKGMTLITIMELNDSSARGTRKEQNRA